MVQRRQEPHLHQSLRKDRAMIKDLTPPLPFRPQKSSSQGLSLSRPFGEQLPNILGPTAANKLELHAGQ